MKLLRIKKLPTPGAWAEACTDHRLPFEWWHLFGALLEDFDGRGECSLFGPYIED